MSFHSLDYLLFLPLVVALYFATPYRFRWVLLLSASLAFYASWRIAFLPLLLISVFVDYFVGTAMPDASRAKRKVLLGMSLAVNLGLLCFFKFSGALSELWIDLARPEGGLIQPMNLLLPLGISFYTFQTLGYVIDLYRGRRQPETHFGYFAVYVTFFPQLIAGPIERSTKLLPQLRADHKFAPAGLAAGSSLMLIGYFKKLVIADALPGPLTTVLSDPAAYSPLGVITAAFGTVYYYYADLSGYADIAIGSALIMGIKLSRNFNRPFAARSVTEFWQRWHITVSNWFRDYLYLPFTRLFGGFAWGRYLGLILTMLVIGLWHGASLNWLAAGLLAGIIICTENYRSKRNAQRRMAQAAEARENTPPLANRSKIGPLIDRLVLWLFLIILGALIAADGLPQAIDFIARMADLPAELSSHAISNTVWIPPYLLLLIIALELYQWCSAQPQIAQRAAAMPRLMRWGFYYAVFFTILVFGVFESEAFLYFRF